MFSWSIPDAPSHGTPRIDAAVLRLLRDLAQRGPLGPPCSTCTGSGILAVARPARLRRADGHRGGLDPEAVAAARIMPLERGQLRSCAPTSRPR